MTTSLPYYHTRELRATIAGQSIRVITKPGFPGWDGVSPTAELLSQAIDAAPEARIALLGCGHGALGAALALRLPRARLTLVDDNAIALEMARRTLTANGARNAQVIETPSLLPVETGAYDQVALDLPQSRVLARRWLVEAHASLRPGGTLYLAGPNELGIQSVIDDAAALFGTAALLTYRRRCRIVRATRGDVPPTAPAWASEPGIAPGTWRELTCELGGRRVTLASLPGVFAYDRLDQGTALLLAHLPDPSGRSVLDIGCGYGAIGIAAALGGAARVDLVDASILAVAAARENLRRLGLAGCEALAGDALTPVVGRRYDLIVSNPPFHAGKQVSYDIAEVFLRHGQTLLARNGRLIVVANRFIRYDRVLDEVFGGHRQLADDGRYWVLSSP